MSATTTTARPHPSSRFFSQGFLSSARVWAGLVAYLVAVKLIINALPSSFRHPSQAAVFEWPMLALWAALGLLGIFLADQTGFPAVRLDRAGWRRLVPAALIGLGFGLLEIVTDLITQSTRWLAAYYGEPSFNIDFPASLFVYSGGAIIVEVIYRLLPMPLLLWLISSVILRGRGQSQTYWTLAVLTSLLEPLSQELMLVRLGMLGLFAALFVQGVGFNLAQAVVFRRYGFLAAIVVRLGHYMLWHILYGNFLYGILGS